MKILTATVAAETWSLAADMRRKKKKSGVACGLFCGLLARCMWLRSREEAGGAAVSLQTGWWRNDKGQMRQAQ